MQGKDLNEKYSDVTTIKVLQYVNDLELKVQQSNAHCVLVKICIGNVRHFKGHFLEV